MRKVIALSVSLALGLAALLATPAVAGDRVGNLDPCIGAHENVIADNVKVEDGASCSLTDSLVLGNMQADGAAEVKLLDTDVKGDVQVKGTPKLRVWGYATIEGNLQVENVTWAWIRVALIEGNCEIHAVDELLLFNVLRVQGDRKEQCRLG